MELQLTESELNQGISGSGGETPAPELRRQREPYVGLPVVVLLELDPAIAYKLTAFAEDYGKLEFTPGLLVLLVYETLDEVLDLGLGAVGPRVKTEISGIALIGQRLGPVGSQKIPEQQAVYSNLHYCWQEIRRSRRAARQCGPACQAV